MSQFPSEAIDVLLPDVCSAIECGHSPATPDRLGFPWCSDCDHRRYLVEWGKTHGWPALSYEGYVLADGMDMWYTTALLGDDERVCALLAAIDEWERIAQQEVA